MDTAQPTLEELQEMMDRDLAVCVGYVKDRDGSVIDEYIDSRVMPDDYASESIADGWKGMEPDAEGRRVDIQVVNLHELSPALMRKLLGDLRSGKAPADWDAYSLLCLLKFYRAGELTPEEEAFRQVLLGELPERVELEEAALRERSARIGDVDY